MTAHGRKTRRPPARRRRACAPKDDQVQRLWEAYWAAPEDDRLRNRLIVQYLPSVQRIAWKLRSKLPVHVDVGDLVQAGTFGLTEAIERFDSSRKVSFSTYAYHRIRGAMLDHLRTGDRVPRSIRNHTASIKRAAERLAERLGRPAGVDELADELGITTERLGLWVRQSQTSKIRSLEDKAGGDRTGHRPLLGEVLEDQRANGPGTASRRRDLLHVVCRGLSEQERLIVILYYYEELPMREIGETLGVCESRISQMHTTLMRRLAGELAARREELCCGDW